MQIYSNTNNFYTNKQNYKTFSKNQTPVAFCSQQKVLDNISKAMLKEMYKEKLINAIKNCDVKVLFEAVGIKATKDLFGKYLSFGLSFMIIFQTILNLCVVIGLVPVTGVTLPFISYGGSSLLVSMASIGIILNVSRIND